MQFSVAVVADKTTAASRSLHFRETSPETEGTNFTEKGKDTSQFYHESYIAYYLIILLFCVIIDELVFVVKDLASVERNTPSSLFPDRERIQSFRLLHPNIEKKDITFLEKLCVSCPNQEKFPRSLYIFHFLHLIQITSSFILDHIL